MQGPLQPFGAACEENECHRTKGIFVSAQDLCGTMMVLDIRTSKPVYQRFLRFFESGFGRHDFKKAAKVQAILWVENYYPDAEWSMDDNQELWDEALNALLDRCIGITGV